MSKKNKSPELFSISAAATKLKRTRRTIERAIENIKPTSTTGGLRKWTLQQLTDGLNRNTFAPITGSKSDKADSGLAAAKSRLMKEQLFALQMKNAITRREFCPVKVVEEVVEIRDMLVREKMLSVPSVASLIHSLANPSVETIYEIIRKEVYGALEELSTPQYWDTHGPSSSPSADQDGEAT